MTSSNYVGLLYLDGNPKYFFFPVFPFFPYFRFVVDRFRLNGYHHVFPLIEIYRFMQLPSRTDDINFIFGRFSVFFEHMIFVFDVFCLFCCYRSKVSLPSVSSHWKPKCMQIWAQTDDISVIYGRTYDLDFCIFLKKTYLGLPASFVGAVCDRQTYTHADETQWW